MRPPKRQRCPHCYRPEVDTEACAYCGGRGQLGLVSIYEGPDHVYAVYGFLVETLGREERFWAEYGAQG